MLARRIFVSNMSAMTFHKLSIGTTTKCILHVYRGKWRVKTGGEEGVAARAFQTYLSDYKIFFLFHLVQSHQILDKIFDKVWL